MRGHPLPRSPLIPGFRRRSGDPERRRLPTVQRLRRPTSASRPLRLLWGRVDSSGCGQARLDGAVRRVRDVQSVAIHLRRVSFPVPVPRHSPKTFDVGGGAGGTRRSTRPAKAEDQGRRRHERPTRLAQSLGLGRVSFAGGHRPRIRRPLEAGAGVPRGPRSDPRSGPGRCAQDARVPPPDQVRPSAAHDGTHSPGGIRLSSLRLHHIRVRARVL